MNKFDKMFLIGFIVIVVSVLATLLQYAFAMQSHTFRIGIGINIYPTNPHVFSRLTGRFFVSKKPFDA